MLTQEQNSALVDELKNSFYDGKTATEASEILHQGVTTVETLTVLKPLTLVGVLGLCGDESKAKFGTHPNITDIRDKIESQDRAGVGMWCELLRAGGTITEGEQTAILASLSATETRTVTSRGVPRIQTEFQSVQSTRTVGEGENARTESFGFPNVVDQESFNAAWVAAGRTL